MLEPVIFPNRHVPEAYRSTVVLTRDNQTLTGAVIEETPDVMLIQTAAGMTLRVLQADIVSRHRASTSFMPAGLLDGLDIQGLADLHAFMKDW
jgi:putative heme-binding domain-containing protein